jgi:hypothetical protein
VEFLPDNGDNRREQEIGSKRGLRPRVFSSQTEFLPIKLAPDDLQYGSKIIGLPAWQFGFGIPNLPAAKAEHFSTFHCKLGHQCRSNPVSGRSLPKTGVFQLSGGDYRLFPSENAENQSLETSG